MGTITARKRADKTVAYTAQIRLKEAGKVVHSESKTFDRQQAAGAWIKKRETELADPAYIALINRPDPTFGKVIEQYIRESKRHMGETKIQILNKVARSELGALACSKVQSKHLVEFAQSLNVSPSTVGNYLSHLAAVFTLAKPAWGYPLDASAMTDARTVTKKMGTVTSSRQRTRRPSLEELDQLLVHFGRIRHKRRDSIPMQLLVCFAMYSTRRQEEITRITWEDFNEQRQYVTVRDMKNPGEKIGNDVRTSLPPEAIQLMLMQSKERNDRIGTIFPYSGESISASFTRACKLLGIKDLHFHDLRHEGISRLFEMGWTIPQVATVSGHRSWSSLKRYTHLHEDGDKYEKWHWKGKLGFELPKPNEVLPT